jgi:hypothetical protein
MASVASTSPTEADVKLSGGSSDVKVSIKKEKPYGSWISPITSKVSTTGSVILPALTVDGTDVYWVEGRPDEGGRCVLVHRSERNGRTQRRDMTPAPFNVRSRVIYSATTYSSVEVVILRFLLFVGS